MDRLFGKELSNLLQPLPFNNYTHLNKIPSKSTRDPAPSRKDGHQKAEAKSTSVNQDDKKQGHRNSIEALEKSDKGLHKDLQLVSEYFDQCLNFMLRVEQKVHNLPNCLQNQPMISEKMRGVLLDWIVELHHKYKMFPQTLYATIMIIDTYLAKKVMKKENLQLLGVTAFFAAAKYEQTYQVPELDDLVHFSAKAFKKQQVIKMEADIIETLEFNLIMTTSYSFFQALATASGMEANNFYLAQYVLQLSLLDTRFLQYKPSLLASAAIYLINKIRKKPESWPDLLQTATLYEEKDLKICARQLCYLLERSDKLPHTKSLKRKFSSPQYQEVARIKLERKK